MNNKIKSYSLIFLFLISGLVIVISAEQIKLPFGINNSILIFLLFLFLNGCCSSLFHLKSELLQFWISRKIIYVFPAIFAGALIAIGPSLLGILTGRVSLQDISIQHHVSITSLVLTLIIVSWEELWFRGIFLNHCQKYLSAGHLSLLMGALFMLMHVLNPKISLLESGPALFFAGALLTRLYFYFKTIWVPIGLHFGNNFINTLVTSPLKNGWLFGDDGYMSAGLLAALFFILSANKKTFQDPLLQES